MQYTLKPWSISNLESLVKHANNPNIAEFMTDGFPYPYTKEHGKKFIEMVSLSNPCNVFAIIVNDEAIGGIGIHLQTDIMKKNAELGYWLSKEMIEYTFKTFDITRIYARPFGNNLASQKVLQKAGLQLEARLKNTIYKNHEYLDELIYAIRKNDFCNL
jgi:[ribosomal protein S5]-alanine N-acetyltransferase